MPTSPAEYGLKITLLALILFVSSTSCSCSRRELTVSNSSTLEYGAVASLRWVSVNMHKYDVNIYCEVLFRASQDGDIIRLEVTKSSLKPKLLGKDECLDKVTVYDGSSFHDAVLGDLCGQEVAVIRSSGSSLLLVFEASKMVDNRYRGFTVSFSRINRVGLIAAESRPTLGAGSIALAVICAVLLYCALFVVVYRRCRYAQRVRRNLTLSGHCDPRTAVMTRQESPLNQNHGQPAHNNFSGPIPDIVTSLDVPSRPGLAHGPQRPGSAQGPQRPGRVRHPAGVTRHENYQQPQMTLMYSSHPSLLNDNCSGYGSDRDEPRHRINSETIGHIQHFIPFVTTDPTGVTYAGNIDEHGILHPPGQQSHLPISASPSVVSAHPYIGHRLEDSRRSQESSHSDRYSPHGSSQDGSGTCCPAYRNKIHNTMVVYEGSTQLLKNMDSEGDTLTFYGMIDGASAAGSSGGAVVSGNMQGVSAQGSGSASRLHNEEDSSLCGPPPSYEEAASGKYSPSPYFPRN